jgi:hypothetical protein
MFVHYIAWIKRCQVEREKTASTDENEKKDNASGRFEYRLKRNAGY